MSLARRDAINEFHEGLLGAREAGSAAAGNHVYCGWSSAKSQFDRFGALLRATKFEGGSVLDFGCGSGDLFAYLKQLNYQFTYRGVDMNARMIELARKSHDADFSIINYGETNFSGADYVFASGVMQFRDPSDEDYYKELTALLFRKCRVALGVNFLSACRDEAEMDSNELYLQPSDVVGLAALTSGHWILDHSYHAGRGDMTFGVQASDAGKVWHRPAGSRTKKVDTR